MGALGEKTLMLLLTDTDSLQVVARDGLNPVVIPTAVFRPVLEWSLSYLNTSAKAPTVEVMRERWGSDIFSDHGLPDLEEDVEESIDWAIEDLKQTYVQQEVGKFTRDLAMSIANADPEKRLEVLGEKASSLSKIYFDLQPRTTRMDIRESGPSLLAEYEIAANTDGIRGMRLGLGVVDEHNGGIWPGELHVIGGPAGTGKSFLANYVAEKEWARGVPTAIFTLENSILMTQMRIACMALQMDITALQSGTLDEADERLLREWCNDVLIASDTPLHILSPDSVGRSPQAIIQTARALEVGSLVVDQLSHMAPADARNQDRRNEVATIVRTLAEGISTGRHLMPCMLLHQVSREGIKAAAATGRIHMTHMAEASEVERSASRVSTLYASDEHKALGRMQLQDLKVRRGTFAHWEMEWAPHRGLIHVLNPVTFDDQPGEAA